MEKKDTSVNETSLNEYTWFSFLGNFFKYITMFMFWPLTLIYLYERWRRS